MIAYTLRLRAPGQPQYYGTINDAKDAGKAHPEIMNDPGQSIDQVDVAIDKAGVLALLNGRQVFVVQRSWTFTKRGGLVEVSLDSSWAISQPLPSEEVVTALFEKRVEAIADVFSPPADDRTEEEKATDLLVETAVPIKELSTPERQALEEWRRNHEFRGHDFAVSRAKNFHDNAAAEES